MHCATELYPRPNVVCSLCHRAARYAALASADWQRVARLILGASWRRKHAAFASSSVHGSGTRRADEAFGMIKQGHNASAKLNCGIHCVTTNCVVSPRLVVRKQGTGNDRHPETDASGRVRSG